MNCGGAMNDGVSEVEFSVYENSNLFCGYAYDISDEDIEECLSLLKSFSILRLAYKEIKKLKKSLKNEKAAPRFRVQ